MMEEIKPGTARPVAQYKGSTLLRVYKSAREASRSAGISDSTIYKCCRGQKDGAAGFRWEYWQGPIPEIIEPAPAVRSIADILAYAREHHMSYGRAVAALEGPAR